MLFFCIDYILLTELIFSDNTTYLTEGEEALCEITATPQSSQWLAPKTLGKFYKSVDHLIW